MQQKLQRKVQQKVHNNYVALLIKFLFFISLIVGRKIDERNAYWKRYGLLKTNLRFLCSFHRLSSIKKDKNNFWNENSDKNISTKSRLSDGMDRNWHSGHETCFSHSIENKINTTMKGGFYFTIDANMRRK